MWSPDISKIRALAVSTAPTALSDWRATAWSGDYAANHKHQNPRHESRHSEGRLLRARKVSFRSLILDDGTDDCSTKKPGSTVSSAVDH
jgi:hypothetical protein